MVTHLRHVGASQALPVALFLFGLEDKLFACRTLMTIHALIKDDDLEAAKLVKFTACNALVATLIKLGAEDELAAQTECAVVHAISSKSHTQRGGQLCEASCKGMKLTHPIIIIYERT